MGEIKKHIELKKDDIKKELFTNIAFMSVAEPGAMGAPGEIIIYNMDGKSYYFNYVYDEINVEVIHKAIPIIKECYFSFAKKKYPDGWKFMYLGFGNNLLIREELYANFSKLIGDVSPADAYGKWEEAAEEILKEINGGVYKMDIKELDSKIEKADAYIREAYQLFDKAINISSGIDFKKLKGSVDIEKYENTIHYIAQHLSYIGLCIEPLNKLYNQKYWEVLKEIKLERDNLSCIFNVEPNDMVSTANKFMWDELKNEFKKIAYSPDCDQDIIDKVNEFYKNKTNEELTDKSERGL